MSSNTIRPWFWGTAAGWLVGLSGCSNDPIEHAPFCTDPACTPKKIDVKGTGTGGAPNGAAGAPTCSTERSISARIVAVDGSTFAVGSGTAQSGSFSATAPALDGTIRTQTVTSPFTLSRVACTNPNWIAVEPAATLGLMPGITGFDATIVDSVVVPVVRMDSLQAVAASLIQYTALDATKAQIVLHFVDRSGASLPKVSTTLVGAERVAYDSGSGYTDDATSTANLGLAFLFNVSATDVPSLRTVSLGGVATGTVAVWAQAGTATLLDITLSSH